jgi:hypothetical protein
MATHGQRRTWRDAVDAALYKRDAAERYRRSQLEGRRGTRVAADRPRPLEFDAGGFPIGQPITSFEQRVARLLGEEQGR